MDIINLELRKLGLKEKEVNVYLAALELGYTSVQNLARQANISRPTAYAIIRGLIKKGLMREIKRKGLIKGEKSAFTAESPDSLLGLLRVQKREIEEREREFIRIISILQSRYYLTGQNEIRTYEGPAGLKLLLDDFSQSQTNEIYFIGEQATTFKPWRERLPEIKNRLGGLKLKETKKSLPGSLIIYDKLIYLLSLEKSALLTENKSIIKLVKALIQ
jgi:sugar-specific transcriptional regulator TrmB